jgi:formamidopyrimidine-DNA glycosylase
VGLGNIYVNEALNRSGISPRRSSFTLVNKNGTPSNRLELLVEEIRNVLSEAIDAGGSTLQDFRGVTGGDDIGWFPVNFRVYGREGQKCVKNDCSAIIRRIVQSNRSTFFCPSCQR